jgi:hypothetical protein
VTAFLLKAINWIKVVGSWISFTQSTTSVPIDHCRVHLDSPAITYEEAKSILEKVVDDRVEKGWCIEVRNDAEILKLTIQNSRYPYPYGP